MITADLARRLQRAGLRWHPASGDRFRLVPAELQGEVFTVSDMIIEAHEFATGTVLGFNGTTEWALDSVALDDALWLPAEHQLRELLGGTFRGLKRSVDDAGEQYRVTAELAGQNVEYTAPDPAEAYGEALLALISESTAD